MTSQDALDFTVIIGNSDIIKKFLSCKHDGQNTFVNYTKLFHLASSEEEFQKISKISFVYDFYYEINIDLNIL